MKIKFNIPDKKWYSFDGADPRLDWVYILVASFLLCVYFIGGGISLWLSNGGASEDSSPNLAAVIGLNKTAINEAITKLNFKNDNHNKYVNGYNGPADPSRP
jgi:hypothetical protein